MDYLRLSILVSQEIEEMQKLNPIFTKTNPMTYYYLLAKPDIEEDERAFYTQMIQTLKEKENKYFERILQERTWHNSNEVYEPEPPKVVFLEDNLQQNEELQN